MHLAWLEAGLCKLTTTNACASMSLPCAAVATTVRIGTSVVNGTKLVDLSNATVVDSMPQHYI